jgi:DNA-binding protein WhiA
MSMENVRIRKQMRGQITRASNCDEHNDSRMMDASLAQIRAITFLRVEHGLYPLPPALRAVAEARLQNPDANLEQLGQALDPPIGKSAVNARMRRLMAIAKELEDRMAAGIEEKP